MDSSLQTRPKKSVLVIGGKSTNPKPYGVSGSTLPDSSKTGVKRDSRNYDDGDCHNLSTKKPRVSVNSQPKTRKLSRQFWKAGDDKEEECVPSYCNNGAAVRVHPQFLHANATSHKWALGALAELLDNSLDEVCNGATYVHVDSATNEKDKNSSILIVQDNGGGMDPSRFRECLSLGYSRKRNIANTVGQYGNGFKTSTMRLGADAIVFSRSKGTNGSNTTQSVGMLSYTYLYETRKCEAVVPTVDFELVDNKWKEIIHDSKDEWFDNLETIDKWSPYLSQQDLFDQFDSLEEQGTRIVIYNLWEDDEGKLELDFDTDDHDIQLRGVNRDEKKIEMANTYPNSRHFLTYRHSLRSYASILYLRLPPNFKIILRGKDVEHHSLLQDMMMTEDITYRPVASPEHSDEDMVAALKIGFVKDAHHHIDIQGFNVYHKNRLIKPFWRVWNAAGSDGRGVIGVLEADFIQPAHNKQGFERTALLARVENRLNRYQKTYWSKRCHEIGYAPRRVQKNQESCDMETSQVPDFNHKSHDKRSFADATPALSRQNVESSRRNRNSEYVTRSSVADTTPDIGLKKGKHRLGISSNETRPVDQAAELQKQKAQLRSQVKQSNASTKPVVEVQRQKTQLEEKTRKVQDASTKQVAELQRQKAQLELQLKQSNKKLKQSKAKIQDLENTDKIKDDDSAELVVELQRQKALLDLQLKKSRSMIQDLENSQKVKDSESAELVDELQEQKALLESQLKGLKDRIHVLQESEDLVVELQREKGLLESQLKVSQAKHQDFEKEVINIFQEERVRRDVTEDALRKKLGVANDVIDTLTMKVNSLEAEQAFCKKVHMRMH